MSPSRLRVLWLNFSSLFVALFIICSFSFCLSPPTLFLGSFPGGSDGRVCLQCGRPRFDPWVGKISCRRKWQPTPVFLPGKFHEREPGYSPWGHKESDTTEQLTHTPYFYRMFQSLDFLLQIFSCYLFLLHIVPSLHHLQSVFLFLFHFIFHPL